MHGKMLSNRENPGNQEYMISGNFSLLSSLKIYLRGMLAER